MIWSVLNRVSYVYQCLVLGLLGVGVAFLKCHDNTSTLSQSVDHHDHQWSLTLVKCLFYARLQSHSLNKNVRMGEGEKRSIYSSAGYRWISSHRKISLNFTFYQHIFWRFLSISCGGISTPVCPFTGHIYDHGLHCKTYLPTFGSNNMFELRTQNNLFRYGHTKIHSQSGGLI
jgi:hypothetical protein